MSETEYSFFMSYGKPTLNLKCVDCVKALCCSSEGTPIHSLQFALTSEFPKKLLYSERELILSSLKGPESLSLQIETVQRNGFNTNIP